MRADLLNTGAFVSVWQRRLMYVIDIVWCMYYVLWKDIICNYVIMCMHDIIVVDDCNSGAQRQAEPVRPRCTSHLCCMCVLFPSPGVSCYPSCSVCSAMYGVARQGSAV